MSKFYIIIMFLSQDGSYVGMDSIGAYNSYDECVQNQELEKQQIRDIIQSFERDFFDATAKCERVIDNI